MLGTGQSRHNTHTGQTTVRQGDMLIDGSLRVRGDLIIDGTLVFNSDVTILPPACLNTDCINSVSGAGITVSDDIDLASNGNNILITNKLNSINTTNTGVRINNSYTLPVDALSANVGDILSLITPAPLATVGFTTPTTATGRIVQNFFQMTNPTTSYNSTAYNPLYTNSNGSDIINTADIAVGGSVRFRTKGYLYNGNLGVTAFGQFRLFIGIGNTSSTFDFYSNDLFIRDVGMTAGDPNVGRGWWEINVTVTKINALNDCTIGVSGLYNCVASTGVTSDTFDIQFYDNPTIFTTRLPNNSSSNTVVPAPFWTALPTTFKLELSYKETAFAAAAIATEYTIDYLNVDQDVLATTSAPATDHLSLANLNGGTGDGGHINLYDRRGVKPMTGNVNMNANDINNVKDINGRGGLNLLQVQNTNGLFYLDGGEIRMTADTSINLYPTTNLRLGNGGQDISINPTTKTDHFGELDMIGNPITNCTSINGLTPVGGLFSGTSDSLNVAATTAEISILPLTFVGVGFGVPPNGFSVGDCFLLNLSGPFNSNNNDTLSIRLKGGPTSTTLLSTLVVPLNASSASVFQLTVFFQIRAIGGAGVADIISDADLTYNQSGAGGSFVGEQSLSQNNTTFDTTGANILDVTAQFSSNSANNDMTTRVSKLQKTY